MANVVEGVCGRFVAAYKYCRYGGKKEGILGHKNRENCSVMVSYYQNHKPFANDIVQAIKDNSNRQVWVDYNEDTSPGGQSWMETLCKAIETHDVFVFIVNENEIWKQDGSQSAYKQEFVHALKNGKKIIPIWWGRMTNSYETIPPPFDTLKTLSHIGFNNVREASADGKPVEDNFKKMAGILQEQIDQDHMHTIVHTLLLTRAIEWEQNDFEKSLLLVGEDLTAADNWVKAAALGKNPKPTTLHLSFIKASAALSESMKKRQLIAVFFLFIVVIGISWPSWGVFFFSLVFSHFFVYFSSSS